MLDQELAEIDTWLVLPFDDFADNVVKQMIYRCLGIIGHSDILWVGFLEQNVDLMSIPRQVKRLVAPQLERLKLVEAGIYTYETAYFNLQQKIAFLQMLINEVTPLTDEVEALINQVPPSEDRSITSPVWNIKENNLVRLRHLLRVCQIYSENIFGEKQDNSTTLM